MSNKKIKNKESSLKENSELIAVDRVIASIAHELNNPLTTILNFANLLKSQHVTTKRNLYIKIIEDEAKRCSDIIKNFRTFAKKEKPCFEKVDINRILENTIEIRKYYQRLNNIKLKKHFDFSLPSIHGNQNQLDQLFLNIIINAEQALSNIEEGSRVIEICTSLKSKKKGRYVHVHIKDNGHGIPEDILPKIFDPFFTTKPHGEGSGLGLYISKEIVETHNGTIKVENSPGHGATFIVELPCCGDF